MRSSSSVLALLPSLALLPTTTLSQEAIPVNSTTLSPPVPIRLSSDVTFTLSADENAGTANVELVFEGQGWVSFGVSPSGAMVGGEAVIGLPDEPVSATNPGKYQLAGESVSGVRLFPSDQQTLMNASIYQNDTHTILTYTKLLEEAGELSVSATDANTFIWATGPSNQLGRHNQQSSFSYIIGSDVILATIPSTRELWIAHGVLMAAAWGILIPIAIGSSLLRGLLPLPKGMWFTIHFYTMLFAVACTITSFALAVKAINDETGGGKAAGHFQGPPAHVAVGLIVFLLVTLQVGIALFRPHPPAATTDEAAPPETDVEAEKEKQGPEEREEKTENAVQGHNSTKKSTHRLVWEIKHRGLAAVLIGMAWYNVDSGIGLYTDKYGEGDNLTKVFWGVVGALLGLILAGYIYSKLKKES